MKILAIESSCDETSVAILQGQGEKIEILSNIVSSQIAVHAPFGGVVPEVAARHHTQNFLPVLAQALAEAKTDLAKIDALAVTSGPGLITSLLVGVQAAKTLSFLYQKPLLGINHLRAHVAANFLQPLTFPALALIVSGGHTELILVKDQVSFKKIGQTLDDAAGEAFDKVAKILGLGYPGGPLVSQQALKGDRYKYDLPRPMLNQDNFNFSFSGLKTAVKYLLAEPVLAEELLKAEKRSLVVADLCASFQQAVVEVLVHKTIKAARQKKVKTIILAGGVAANKELRQQLQAAATQNGLSYVVPEFALCTDNAAMIASAAYWQIQRGGWQAADYTAWRTLRANPVWEI